jgi:hypothetical protein
VGKALSRRYLNPSETINVFPLLVGGRKHHHWALLARRDFGGASRGFRAARLSAKGRFVPLLILLGHAFQWMR